MAGQLTYYLKRGKRALAGMLIGDAWKKKAFYLKEEYPDELTFENEILLLKKFNCKLAPGEFGFVLERYDVLRILHEKLNATMVIESGELRVSFHGFTFNPTTAEELFILEEVFVTGTYNFSGNNTVTVIDVGMNVGSASLFFAQHKQVRAVYSFEPFTPTFNQALKNISLNPSLAKKITPHNIGLSSREEKLTVDYNYENKGQVGVYGTSLIRSEIKEVEKTVISLKPVHVEFKKIFEQNPGNRFALKLDCEGAEYDIMKSLSAENQLSFFDMIFIEWHEKGPDELLHVLQQHGFSAVYQQASTKKVGMIYAIR